MFRLQDSFGKIVKKEKKEQRLLDTTFLTIARVGLVSMYKTSKNLLNWDITNML